MHRENYKIHRKYYEGHEHRALEAQGSKDPQTLARRVTESFIEEGTSTMSV